MNAAVANNLEKLELITNELTLLEDSFKHLFMLFPHPMCAATRDFKFQIVNPAWTKALGYSKQELEGKCYLEFIHPDDIEATKKVASGLNDKDVMGFQNRYRHKEGHWVTLEWTACTYSVGGKTYAMARVVG